MAQPILQCTFMTLMSSIMFLFLLMFLLIVNNLLYYDFNGHIFRSSYQQGGFLCNGLISTFYRCQLVLIGGGGELEISIIELPLTYCFVHIILTMPIKFSYLCFAFCLVIFCVLLRKCLNALLSLEFHHKLLSCLYLAILSNYLTWCISIILLSGDIEINPGPKSRSRECF